MSSTLTVTASAAMVKSLPGLKLLAPGSDKDAYHYWMAKILEVIDEFGYSKVVKDQLLSTAIATNTVHQGSMCTEHEATAALNEAKTDVEKARCQSLVSAIQAGLTEKDARCSRVVHNFLTSMMEAKLFTLLQPLYTHGDSFGLMQQIRLRFQPLDSITGFQAQHDLLSASMNANESITEFSNRVAGLEDEVKRFPKSVELERIMIRYCRLPAEVQRLIKPELLNNVAMTYIQFHSLLHRIEKLAILDRKARTPSAAALAARSGDKQRISARCEFCKKKYHTAENCFINPDNPNNRIEEFEQRQSESGEESADSAQTRRSKPRSTASSKFKSAIKRSDGSSVPKKTTFALFASVNSHALAAWAVEGRVDNAIPFFVDTGATGHMCNDARIISDLRSCVPYSVKGFNGTSVWVSQKGKVKLGPFNQPDGSAIELQLTNVGFSTELDVCLISTSHMWKTGGHECTFGGSAVIHLRSKASKWMSVRIPLVHGMYVHNQPIGIGTERLALAAAAPAADIVRPAQSPLQATELLHRQVGHFNAQSMRRLLTHNAATDLDKQSLNIDAVNSIQCDSCNMSKSHNVPFADRRPKSAKASKPGQRFHADIMGPVSVSSDIPNFQYIDSLSECKYLSVVVDEFSSMVFVQPIKKKSEAAAHVQSVIRTGTRMFGAPTESLRTDGGKEFTSSVLQNYLKEQGITHEVTPPYTPQLNGKVERMNRTLMECCRSLLFQALLSPLFWIQAVKTAAYLYNRFHVRTGMDKTAYELFHGSKPSASALVTFGCNAFVHIPDEKHSNKVNPTAERGIMIGYDESNHRSWQILLVNSLQIVRSHHVKFDEGKFSHVELLNMRLLEDHDSLHNSQQELLSLSCNEIVPIDDDANSTSIINQDDLPVTNPFNALAVEDDSPSIANSDFDSAFEGEFNNDYSLRESEDNSDPDAIEELPMPSGSASAVNSRPAINRRSSARNANVAPVQQSHNYGDNHADRETYLRNTVAKRYSKADQEVKDNVASFYKPNWNATSFPIMKLAAAPEIFYSVCNALGCPIQLDSTPEVRLSAPAPTFGVINYNSEVATGIADNIFGDQQALLTKRVSQEVNDPNTLSEALDSDDRDCWIKAVQAELDSLKANRTWSAPMDLPKGRKALPTKWVFKIKRDANGATVKYKARFTPKGFRQRHGEDYNETFAPVMKYATFRILMALAAAHDLEIQQFDVDSAFLHATLEEEIYITQPEGATIPGTEGQVLRLFKSLYGLKQAPYMWNKEINGTFIAIGFSALKSDPCVFRLQLKSGRQIIIGLFVDDAIILFDQQDVSEWLRIKKLIKDKYSIKDMGNAQFILGMRIVRNRKQRTILIDQQAYIEKTLNKLGHGVMRSMKTPGTPVNDLTFDEALPVADDNSKQLYQSYVGSAIYASISTRLDIAHATGIIARFAANPQTKHFHAAVRVMRYLSGTKEIPLTMDGKLNGKPLANAEICLSAFTDSDWAGDRSDSKSTSGSVIKINNSPVLWLSKKQTTVARSSCEAEIIAIGETVRELQWIHGLLIELNFLSNRSPPATIYCDNASSVRIGTRDLANTRTKHIAVSHHFIKEACDRKEIIIKWISNTKQQADIFTKPLGAVLFNQFRSLLMGEC